MLFLLISLTSLCPAAEIKLKNATPVFEKPDIFSREVGTLQPGRWQIKKLPQKSFSVRHPIAYIHHFAELEQGGFVSPDVGVNDRGEPYSIPPSFQWQTPVMAFLLALLAVMIFLFVKGKKEKTLLPESGTECAYFIFFAIILRQILVLSETSFWGNALPCASDEPGYFKAIYDILHSSFAGPWHFTVGLGIFYLPFILFTGAKEYYDIAVIFSYTDALVLAPAALAAGFMVLKGFRIKSRTAFAAILLWALYPFFVYHSEFWNKLHFAPILSLPCSFEFVSDWWRFYAVCINAGFNAMSDTPALLTLLLTLLLAQKLPFSLRNAFILGCAFGFCCLIRINYIFLAPVLAFVVLEKMPDKKNKILALTFLCAAGGFLTLFIWQLLINFHQFGNPLTFGYSLHYLDFAPEKRPDTGFNWSTLFELRNIKFLVGANKLLMITGIAGLLFIRDRYTRIALTLTAVPLLLFFFGYTHTYCDARRFILIVYPVFLAAFALSIANLFNVKEKNWKRFLPFMIIPVMLLLWAAPAEIHAICLCLLLVRTLFDLQQELLRGILRT